jgi:hypothetical protein
MRWALLPEPLPGAREWPEGPPHELGAKRSPSPSATAAASPSTANDQHMLWSSALDDTGNGGSSGNSNSGTPLGAGLVVLYTFLDGVLIFGILYLGLYLLPRCIYLVWMGKQKAAASKVTQQQQQELQQEHEQQQEVTERRQQQRQQPERATASVWTPGLKNPRRLFAPEQSMPGSPTVSPADSFSVAADPQRLVTMRCKVPRSLQTGQPLLWRTPSGRVVSMRVPEGSSPGQQLEFRVPAMVLAPSDSPASLTAANPPTSPPSSPPHGSRQGSPGYATPGSDGRRTDRSSLKRSEATPPSGTFLT